MTRLGTVDSRGVTRETADQDPCYHRRLMVRLHEGGRFLELWQKGRRHRVRVTYGEVFQYALMRDAHAAARERREQKAAKRKTKR